MSYILDALRRADAERERDPARGIHAQPGAGLPANGQARVPAWAWAAGGCVVVAAAGLLAWPRQAPTAPSAPAPAVAMRPGVTAAVPVAAAVQPPAPPPQATKVVPVPVALAPVARVPESPPKAASAAPAPATPPAAADRVFNIAELPADVQSQLPKLAISGGVHSDNAAQRMLIVGGQVVNEGAELAPGVVLEQIRARTAVLRFRGYRYSVGY